MRYRLLANYQGAPYEAGVGPQESGVVLFAACPPPEDLGFEPATGHWRKEVGRGDVQTLYESRPVGIFRGERCVVLDDLSDRLHITYLGHDAFRAEQLGYWEVDRGVYELITPRQEVTEIVEQRVSVPRPGESVPHQQPAKPGHGPASGHSSMPGSGPRAQPLHDPLGGPSLLTPRHASHPKADEDPLPLEAQAMRAARKAKRSPTSHDGGDAPGAAGPGPQPAPDMATRLSDPAARLSEPSAGLSEPSTSLPTAEDAASPVPSWSPQAVAPQPAAGQPAPQQEPGRRSAQAAGQGVPADSHTGASVVSGGFVAGVSPAVGISSASGQNEPAGTGASAGPFIGSAPVPHPG
ncbi:MAG: hypothetical protein ACTHJW_06165, partial [Streptosporangiaceae bacterium]